MILGTYSIANLAHNINTQYLIGRVDLLAFWDFTLRHIAKDYWAKTVELETLWKFKNNNGRVILGNV